MTNSNIIWLVACALAVGAIIWVAVAMSPTPPTPTTAADPSALPGIATTTLAIPSTGSEQADATWPVETANLAARLAADSMEGQTMEGQVLHIHQHLDVFIHSMSIVVPADIGIHAAEKWLSAIHTHDSSGIIHVEAPFKATFTLGQFFDIWGVLFTKDCIGGYCADGTNMLQVYVNGELYQGDPRTLALDAHQELAIAFGTASETPASIPSTYNFPAGL